MTGPGHKSVVSALVKAGVTETLTIAISTAVKTVQPGVQRAGVGSLWTLFICLFHWVKTKQGKQTLNLLLPTSIVYFTCNN